MRELGDEAVRHQAEQLLAYIGKGRNYGVAGWLDTKGFGPADRAAIISAVGDLIGATPEEVCRWA